MKEPLVIITISLRYRYQDIWSNVTFVFCYHQVCGLLICEGLKNPVVCTCPKEGPKEEQGLHRDSRLQKHSVQNTVN